MSIQENKSHAEVFPDLSSALLEYETKIRARGNLPHITIEEQLLILADFASFPLGQHILLTGGANGIWTDYIISPQYYIKENNLQVPLSVIERFMLFHSPVVIAQRELLMLLQTFAQSNLGDNKVFASIPCGMMRDLLSLDFSSAQNVQLVGIDLDTQSIDEAQKLATKLERTNVKFLQRNAWNLDLNNEFDLISSIGLNMYESDKEKVIELYRQLYLALKPGGILFTGALTCPSYVDKLLSDWNTEIIPKYDLHLEEVIHQDILQIKWFNFRRLSEMEDDFRKAGFSNVKIQLDSRRIFPAIIAQK